MKTQNIRNRDLSIRTMSGIQTNDLVLWITVFTRNISINLRKWQGWDAGRLKRTVYAKNILELLHRNCGAAIL